MLTETRKLTTEEALAKLHQATLKQSALKRLLEEMNGRLASVQEKYAEANEERERARQQLIDAAEQITED